MSTAVVVPAEAGGSSAPLDADAVASFVRGHVPLLDGVRGLAVLLLLAHQFVLDVLPAKGAPAAARLLEDALEPGWVGVQLFFVLSGFLITGVLLDSKGRPNYLRSFYARRVLRIFPLYYLLLVTLAFVLPHLGPVPPLLRADAGAMPLAWIYLSNWTVKVPAPIGHCWSLAVEEQFYLLWPFVVAASSSPRLLRICFGLAVLALGVRIAVLASGLSPEIAYQNTFARIDALALGAAGALLVRQPAMLRRFAPGLRFALVAAALSLVGCAAFGLGRTGAVTQIAGYSLLAIVFALIIVVGVLEQAAAGGRLSATLSSRPLRLFGKYSYGIYILQLPVHIFVSKTLLARWLAYRDGGPYVFIQLVYSAGMTALLLGLAMLSYHLYEKHFLRLKRHFPAA
jgi:peptidoglycan/LPS O-acetylase OafA/YrhL